MFQAKISPILTLWYKAPTMLPAGDQEEVEMMRGYTNNKFIGQQLSLPISAIDMTHLGTGNQD